MHVAAVTLASPPKALLHTLLVSAPLRALGAVSARMLDVLCAVSVAALAPARLLLHLLPFGHRRSAAGDAAVEEGGGRCVRGAVAA